MPTADLPQFDEAKVYFVWGTTLNTILSALRSNRPRGTEGGGVTIHSEADGSYASADQQGGGGGEPDKLPEKFDDAKLYLLTSATIELLERAAKKNHTYAVEGGGLTADEDNAEGVWLSASDD